MTHQMTRNFCEYLVTALTFLGAWLFIAALGPFQFGIWFQSEPVTFVLLAVSGCLSLCFIPLLGSHSILHLWKTPLMLALWGLVLWSAAMSFFVDYPIRSLLGSPEIGQGALGFLCLILLVTGYYITLQQRKWHIPLLVNLTLAAITATLIQNTLTEAYWLPAKWPDYLGFIAPCLLILLLSLSPRQSTQYRIGYYLGCGAITLFSDSHLAILVWGLMGIAIAGFYALKPLTEARYKHLLIAAISVPIIYSLSCLFPEFYHLLYASLTGNETELSFYNSSSGTRILFGTVVWEAMLANPLHWLTGAGWGHFTDALLEYPFVANVSNNPPNWVFTSGSAFHSHNNYLEALYSAGVIGLACFIATPLFAIRSLGNSTMVWAGTAWVSLAIMLGAWFMLGISLPFIAAAIATTIYKMNDTQGENSNPRWAQGLLIVTALGLFAAANWHYTDAHKGRAYMDSLKIGAPQAAISAPESNHRLWWVALNFADYLNKKTLNPKLSISTQQSDIAWFHALLTQLDDRLPEGTPNARLRILRAHMINDLILFYREPYWKPLRSKAAANWHNVLWSAIKVHPTRGDIAVPYYQYFLDQSQPDSLLLLSEPLLERNPNDPTALWYSGSAMGGDAGKERIEKALALGAQKRFQTPTTEKD